MLRFNNFFIIQQSQLSPSELKIITLEKSLVDIQESIKEMQKFWLRGQGHLCHLSEERQEQIKENTLLKKRINFEFI